MMGIPVKILHQGLVVKEDGGVYIYMVFLVEEVEYEVYVPIRLNEFKVEDLMNVN